LACRYAAGVDLRRAWRRCGRVILAAALQAGFIKGHGPAGRGYIALAGAESLRNGAPWYALMGRRAAVRRCSVRLETAPDVIEALVNFKVQGQLPRALP